MTTSLASLKRAAYHQTEEIEDHIVSNAELTPFRALVRRVARSFFDGPEIIVLDYFTFMKTPITTDYELAQALKVNTREAHKFCGKLVEHRLLRMETKGDQKRPDGKQLSRTYYALDYKLFADVIKWKLLKIDKHIRARMEREMDHRGYACPECQTKYTALEAMRHCEQFMNDQGNPDFRFVCKIDQMLLEEDQHSEVLLHGNLVLEQLYTQNQKIMDLIRECDQVKLPKYIVSEPLTKKLKLDRDVEEMQFQAVSVEFIQEEKQQETLPIWHRQSTVRKESLSTDPKQAVVDEPNEVDEYYKTYLSEYTQKMDTGINHVLRIPPKGMKKERYENDVEEEEEDSEEEQEEEQEQDGVEDMSGEFEEVFVKGEVEISQLNRSKMDLVDEEIPSLSQVDMSMKEVEFDTEVLGVKSLGESDDEEDDDDFEFVEVLPT